jgi:biopolymer transport protein ExbD
MKFYTRRRKVPTIVIVSLIDIMVLLLIFFVVTTRFIADQPAVEVNLAESKTATTSQSEAPVVVSVTAKGEVFVAERAVTLDNLAVAIEAARTSAKGFALKADTKSDFGTVLKVLDAFKQAGVSNVPAFTAPPPSPQP